MNCGSILSRRANSPASKFDVELSKRYLENVHVGMHCGQCKSVNPETFASEAIGSTLNQDIFHRAKHGISSSKQCERFGMKLKNCGGRQPQYWTISLSRHTSKHSFSV